MPICGATTKVFPPSLSSILQEELEEIAVTPQVISITMPESGKPELSLSVGNRSRLGEHLIQIFFNESSEVLDGEVVRLY